MKTDLSPDIELLPRADLPEIWEGFRAKAEQLRETATTLVVASVEEKDKMELARTTRLTLRQIRIAVEKKRVELGQGHLSEIQKINGAANKLKELIEPLETRLLEQESFAERAEAARIAALSVSRTAEVRAIWPGCPGDFGKMPDVEYDALIARLRADAAAMAEEKRRVAEAEALAVREREAAEASRRAMQAQLDAQQAEAQRLARAAAAEAEIKLAAERAELQRQNERVRREYEEQTARENAARAVREAEEKRQWEEADRANRAAFDAAEKKRREERQLEEAKRLELEAALAKERAAKLAEERRLHALALAPDKEQLQAFNAALYNIPLPVLKTPEALAALNRASGKITEAMLLLDVFCKDA